VPTLTLKKEDLENFIDYIRDNYTDNKKLKEIENELDYGIITTDSYAILKNIELAILEGEEYKIADIFDGNLLFQSKKEILNNINVKTCRKRIFGVRKYCIKI
jgi:hypothetical protein